MESVGIYRVSGVKSEIDRLRLVSFSFSFSFNFKKKTNYC